MRVGKGDKHSLDHMWDSNIDLCYVMLFGLMNIYNMKINWDVQLNKINIIIGYYHKNINIKIILFMYRYRYSYSYIMKSIY